MDRGAAYSAAYSAGAWSQRPYGKVIRAVGHLWLRHEDLELTEAQDAVRYGSVSSNPKTQSPPILTKVGGISLIPPK